MVTHKTKATLKLYMFHAYVGPNLGNHKLSVFASRSAGLILTSPHSFTEHSPPPWGDQPPDPCLACGESTRGQTRLLLPGIGQHHVDAIQGSPVQPSLPLLKVIPEETNEERRHWQEELTEFARNDMNIHKSAQHLHKLRINFSVMG